MCIRIRVFNFLLCITQKRYYQKTYVYTCIHMYTYVYTHMFYLYSTGPGGEDLEGGYYDAGDNLKVICDHHC